MSRLRSSLDYFEKSNPQSIELENIKALYDTGGDALNREFGEVLKKNSIATPAVELLNAISMPEEATEIVSIQHFPEGINNLKRYVFDKSELSLDFGIRRCKQ